MLKQIITATLFFVLSSCLVVPSPLRAELVDGTIAHSITEVDFLSADEGILPAKFIGSATYTIPIDVPDGRQGMTPDLKLKYNSLFRDSWVGFGWQLEFGSIERNTKFGVDYGSDDFVYRTSDGAYKLVKISNGEFRLEIEGRFLRFVRKTASDGRPMWVMTNKSGVKYYFGSDTYTRQDNFEDSGQVFKWCLERIEDPNGNYITATYDKDLENNQIYLEQIEYTGHESVDPAYSIHFLREDRTDLPARYLTRFRNQMLYRLTGIEIKAGSSLIKRYDLNSAPSATSNRMLLNSVATVGKDGSSILRTMEFDYSQTSFKLVDKGKWGKMSSSGSSLVVDLNGDGRHDYFRGPDPNGTTYRFISNGSKFLRSSYRTGYSSDPSRTYPTAAADINGDGTQEILVGPSLIYPTKCIGQDDRGRCDTIVPNYDANPLKGGQIFVLDYQNGSLVKLGAWTTETTNVWKDYEKSVHVADMNGDGRKDLVIGPDGHGDWRLLLSTGSSFDDQGIVLHSAYSQFFLKNELARVVDVTGDRSDELVLGPDIDGSYFVLDYSEGVMTKSQWYTGNIGASARPEAVRSMDLNGDKLTDLLITTDSRGDWFALLSTGHSFVYDGLWAHKKYKEFKNLDHNRIHSVDLTGDGLLDIVVGPDSRGCWFLMQNTGKSLIDRGEIYRWGNSVAMAADLRGNGRQGLLLGNSLSFIAPKGDPPDLLKEVRNGIGGTTQISYTPSASFPNARLPFAIPVVSQIVRNDGKDNISTTNYDYSGGYYHYTEKDFRGFAYVKETGPVGADNEQKVVETWYHQGAGVTPEADDPSVEVGVTKSYPYLEAVSDENGIKLRETETTYAPSASANQPYYFSPPKIVEGSWCDSTGHCQVHDKMILKFDGYGNLTRKDEYGNPSDPNDGRTTIINYSANTTDWLVGFPYKKTVYNGILVAVDPDSDDPVPASNNKLSQTTYDYDNGSSDCSSSGTNRTPILGNLTRKTHYLDGTNDPEEWFGYDDFGNQICSRDANGHISTVSYDSTATYARIVTNAKGHQLVNRYYGVDDEVTDNGNYGQLKSMTDPNGAWKSFKYDEFGRRQEESLSDGSSATWSYKNFGTVGLQHARLDNSLGLWYELYFDGRGKIITTRQPGPGDRAGTDIIVNSKIYDQRGLLKQESLPYFEDDTAYYQTNHYDALGRVLQINKPDGAIEMSCYGKDGSQVSIDANQHKKRQVLDAYGNLTRVDEYQGSFASCNTAVGSPYAITLYEYDSVNNLTQVENATGNLTKISYDPLGRKTQMDDPDMGVWQYAYDAAGNLTFQQDAKGQIILFQYDPLNRLTRKSYATGSLAYGTAAESAAGEHHFGYLNGNDLYLPSMLSGSGDLSISDEVIFSYDDPTRNNTVGRISHMEDISGSTDYSYLDPLARTSIVTRTIDGQSYAIQTQVDAMLRTQAITYPGNTLTVAYLYDDAGNLSEVGNYAELKEYNAFGKAQKVQYQNGVIADYSYYSENGRLQGNSLATTTATYFDRQYSYFANGNVQAITDADGSKTQSFTYDELDRLRTATSAIYGALTYNYDKLGNLTHKEGIDFFTDTAAKPHQLVSSSNGRFYDYDANGNMLSDGLRSFEYDAENRPASISYNGGVTQFVYDGNGQRVKKSGPNGETLYIGKLYEVNGSSSAKYIFAGDKRIAMVREQATLYYHQDHLGGTSVVTDANGNLVEQVFYKPFGETVEDTGSVSLNHKYTGQELDAETGLYNYGARYYSPEIGRFVSADSLIPHYDNPQSYNRYSYVLNNPVKLLDPTGHVDVSVDSSGHVSTDFGKTATTQMSTDHEGGHDGSGAVGGQPDSKDLAGFIGDVLGKIGKAFGKLGKGKKGNDEIGPAGDIDTGGDIGSAVNNAVGVAANMLGLYMAGGLLGMTAAPVAVTAVGLLLVGKYGYGAVSNFGNLMGWWDSSGSLAGDIAAKVAPNSSMGRAAADVFDLGTDFIAGKVAVAQATKALALAPKEGVGVTLERIYARTPGATSKQAKTIITLDIIKTTKKYYDK